MPTLPALVLLIFPALAIGAGLKDATSYTIPNWLTGALALAFAPAALAAGLTPLEAGLNLAVGFAALVAGMVMFALGWIGGGDAKLMAACALWLGLPGLATFLMVTGIGGGALAVGLLYARKLPRPALVEAQPWAARLLTPGENVPYGVAIACGALAAFPASAVMRALHG